MLSLSTSGSPILAYHHGNLREALLDRAAEVVADQGVEAVSLRALARDLGVSHAAPSRHFPDRRALLAELAKTGLLRCIDAMNRGAEAAGPDPVARYRALGRSYVQFAREQPSYFRAINHPEVQAAVDPELRRVEAEWFTTLRDGAEAAKRAGWHPETETDALVAFSVAAAMGAAALFADERWHAVLDVDDPDGLADAVLDLTVHRSRSADVPEPQASSPEENKRKAS